MGDSSSIRSPSLDGWGAQPTSASLHLNPGQASGIEEVLMRQSLIIARLQTEKETLTRQAMEAEQHRKLAASASEAHALLRRRAMQEKAAAFGFSDAPERALAAQGQQRNRSRPSSRAGTITLAQLRRAPEGAEVGRGPLTAPTGRSASAGASAGVGATAGLSSPSGFGGFVGGWNSTHKSSQSPVACEHPLEGPPSSSVGRMDGPGGVFDRTQPRTPRGHFDSGVIASHRRSEYIPSDPWVTPTGGQPRSVQLSTPGGMGVGYHDPEGPLPPSGRGGAAAGRAGAGSSWSRTKGVEGSGWGTHGMAGDPARYYDGDEEEEEDDPKARMRAALRRSMGLPGKRRDAWSRREAGVRDEVRTSRGRGEGARRARATGRWAKVRSALSVSKELSLSARDRGRHEEKTDASPDRDLDRLFASGAMPAGLGGREDERSSSALQEGLSRLPFVAALLHGVRVTKHCQGIGRPHLKVLFLDLSDSSLPRICWCQLPGRDGGGRKDLSLFSIVETLVGVFTRTLQRYGSAHDVVRYLSFTTDQRTVDFEFVESADRDWFDKGINACLHAIAKAYQRRLAGDDFIRFVQLATDGAEPPQTGPDAASSGAAAGSS